MSKPKLLLFEIISDVSFLIGAAAGILFGFSFARKKGDEFRRDLNTKYKKGGTRSAGEHLLSESHSSATQAFGILKTFVQKSGIQKKLSSNVSKWMNDIHGNMSDACAGIQKTKKIIKSAKKSTIKSKKKISRK